MYNHRVDDLLQEKSCKKRCATRSAQVVFVSLLYSAWRQQTYPQVRQHRRRCLDPWVRFVGRWVKGRRDGKEGGWKEGEMGWNSCLDRDVSVLCNQVTPLICAELVVAIPFLTNYSGGCRGKAAAAHSPHQAFTVIPKLRHLAPTSGLLTQGHKYLTLCIEKLVQGMQCTHGAGNRLVVGGTWQLPFFFGGGSMVWHWEDLCQSYLGMDTYFCSR